MVEIFCVCRFDKIGEELPLIFLSVVVGAHSLKLYESSQKRHFIEHAVMHEHYDFDTNRNDIMLLRLETGIRFNNKVQPICVDASVFPTNTPCYVTGWGSIEPDTNRKYMSCLLLRKKRKQCSVIIGLLL